MICIIGGGPAGSYAAKLLAKSHRVIVVEEHEQIGSPVQCTGIITPDFTRFAEPVIVNTIKRAVLHSPNQKLKLKLACPNLVIDRQKTDQRLASAARKAGASYLLGTRAEKISRVFGGFRVSTPKGTIKPRIIIGADGPLSTTAKSLQLYTTKSFLKTKQLVLKKRNENLVEFFFLKGGFGWLVPESGTMVRAGVAALNNPSEVFSMLEKKARLDTKAPVAIQGGLIPVFSSRGQRAKDNAYLVGDAAGFVKATTGGGLVQGLCSSQLLAKAILENRSYAYAWQRTLLPELVAHRLAFNALAKLGPAELDKLILRLRKIRTLLETESRDNFLSLGLKAVLRQPLLLSYLGPASRKFYKQSPI
jgi:digeranylgeranylglycerophospholipid reductase